MFYDIIIVQNNLSGGNDKKTITLALIAAIVTANTSAFAAPIPRECAPYGTDEAAIIVTENLISPILDSEGDFCYWDIPMVDSAYYNRASKLLMEKVLTSNLRSMEEDGLLTRGVFPEVPPRVEYTLTETGYSLKPILDSMVKWGSDYQNKKMDI